MEVIQPREPQPWRPFRLKLLQLPSERFFQDLPPWRQGTSTALPTTGFADEVGLPALVGAAIALIIIIFLARRLRFSNTN